MNLLDRLRTRLTDDPRLARMLHGGASSLASRIVAIAISFVTLPLTVRYLGKQEYGVWVTISTSVVMFSVLDLGIANTLTNFISEAFAADDKQKAQRYYSTAFWLTAVIAVAIALIAGAVWPLIDFGHLLRLSDPVHVRHATLCVAIAVGYFILSLPLNLADRVLGGYQQVHVANYFQMLNSLLGLVALLVVIHVRGDIATLMFAFCSAMLAGALAKQIWLSFWSKPWLKPYPHLLRPSIAKKLFSQGALFFVLQLTGLVVFNSDNLVITHFLGAAEVTPYSVAWRLTSYASLLQSLLIPSFWPAFTEAYKKREMDWVRETYYGMERRVLTAVGVVALLIGLFGRPFIRVWAGDMAQPPLLLLWTMAFWAVLVSVTTNQALLLTAVNRLKLETTVAVLAAVANLCLSIYLVQKIGAEGVILSTVLSFLIFMVGPQQLEVNKVLRGDFLPRKPSGKKKRRFRHASADDAPQASLQGASTGFTSPQDDPAPFTAVETQ